MSYLPNKLNTEFDTYTYTLNWYMVHPREIHHLERNLSRRGRAILIASNATDSKLTITKCETVLIVGPNKVGEGVNSRIDLTIEEPIGTTLIPKIDLAAKQLKIKNYQEARYLLEIKFVGRDPRTGASKELSEKFYYPMFIKFMSILTRSEGTRYNIAGVETLTQGFMHNTATIKNQTAILARTFGDFLTKFEVKLNTMAKRDADYNPHKIYPNEYELELLKGLEDWAEWKLGEVNESKQIGITYIKNSDEYQINIADGSRIDAVIESVLRSTDEYKKIPSLNRGKTIKSRSDRYTMTHDLREIPAFVKIWPAIEYGNYDPLSNSYQQKIKYLIHDYAMPDQIIDIGAQERGYYKIDAQREKLRNIRKNNMLQKRYDYLHTGKNTEVINLDLNFDFLYFYATLPAGGGTGTPDMYTGASYNDNQATITNTQYLAELKKQFIDNNKAIKELSASTANIPDQTFAQQTVNELEDLELQNSIIREDLVRQAGIIEDSAATEDVHLIRAVADNANVAYTTTSGDITSAASTQMGHISINQKNAADLLVIEMQIRGDPYWLGLPKTLENVAITSNSEIANLLKNSVLFWLHVNLPVSDINEAGVRSPQSNYQFSGLYRVIDIISNFESGQFVQYLKAVYDPSTNVKLLFDELNADAPVDSGLQTAVFSPGTQFDLAREQEIQRDTITI